MESQQRRSQNPRAGAVTSKADRRVPADAGQHIGEGHTASSLEQQLARLRAPATDHDFVRIERVDRIRHADPHPFRPDLDDARGDDIPGASRLHRIGAEYRLTLRAPSAKGRIPVARSGLSRETVERAPRRELLEGSGPWELAR